MSYLLLDSATELERLRLQARAWEPESDRFLDAIGIQPGWRCLDLGCGAMGVLGGLARRVGPAGEVIGVENEALQLYGAREYVRAEDLPQVRVLEADAYDTGLPAGSFDLVHARFLFAPAGRDQALLAEMLRLTRPGGVVAIQEPDSSSWTCWPSADAWDTLKRLILEAFRRGGGDFDVGRRTFGMLTAAGLHDVRVRAAVLGLDGREPYARLPLQFARSLRARIVEGGLATDEELDDLLVECGIALDRPGQIVLTFAVTQVWGRLPGAA